MCSMWITATLTLGPACRGTPMGHSSLHRQHNSVRSPTVLKNQRLSHSPANRRLLDDRPRWPKMGSWRNGGRGCKMQQSDLWWNGQRYHAMLACEVVLTTATGVARKHTGKMISVPAHTTLIAKRASSKWKQHSTLYHNMLCTVRSYFRNRGRKHYGMLSRRRLNCDIFRRK